MIPNSNEDEDIVESADESESKSYFRWQAKSVNTFLESDTDDEEKGMIDQSDEEGLAR